MRDACLPPRIAINVISGAPRSVLERCLAHVDTARRVVREHASSTVHFVDNSGCGAETWVRQAYPDIHYLARPRPQGFAANANLSLRSDAEYVLLLNNDAFLREDTLLQLLEALQRHPRWAAVSAHLQNEDGSDQGTGFSFPSLGSTLLALSGLRRDCFLHGCQRPIGTQDIEVDWAPATCLLVRRAALEAIGTLDERFDPGYGEDIDWCKRASHAGWRIGVCANARVVHLRSASFSALGAEQFALFIRHLCLYHRKHAPPSLARLTAFAIGLGMSLRSVTSFRLGSVPRPARSRFWLAAKAAWANALAL